MGSDIWGHALLAHTRARALLPVSLVSVLQFHFRSVFLISVTGTALCSNCLLETGCGLQLSPSHLSFSPSASPLMAASQLCLLHDLLSPSTKSKLLPRELEQPFSAARQAVSLPFPNCRSPSSQSRHSLGFLSQCSAPDRQVLHIYLSVILHLVL